MSHDPHSANQNPEGRTERPNYMGIEIPYGALYIVMATVVAVTIIFALLMIPMVKGAIFLDGDKAATRPGTLSSKTDRPAGPLLQEKPEQDFQAFKASEQYVVHSYGWRDHGAGVARIPLDEAKKLVLRDGVSPISPSPAVSATQPVPELEMAH